jgi:predicted nucleic acid-binding protein
MATYFDSSAVLEVLLGGAQAERVAACWDQETDRVTSILLEAEAVTVLRRLQTAGRRKVSGIAVAARLAALDEYLRSMTIQEVDWDVLALLRKTPQLGGCRSLDALHLATAWLFQQHLSEPLNVCSLDADMRRLAEVLAFRVMPA